MKNLKLKKEEKYPAIFECEDLIKKNNARFNYKS